MANRVNVLGLTVVLLLLLLVLGAGCSTSAGEQPALDGTTWKLTSWAEPEPIPDSAPITAQFSDGRIAGSAGVNRYNAAVSSGSDGSFSIDQPVTTKMAGAEDATAAEKAFLKRLQAATSYRFDGDALVIYDADGQSSLTFTRT